MRSGILSQIKKAVRKQQHKVDIWKIKRMVPFTETASVHLSIDDVHQMFVEANDYKSIFNQPFLLRLKKIHDEFGAKFTLYCFDDEQNRLKPKYCKELAESGWIKIGYHADWEGDATLRGYQNFNSYYLNNGVPLATILRLHMFGASADLLDLLKDGSTLLCADDGRTSYGIPSKFYGGGYQTDGIRYIPTDIRLEKMLANTIHSGHISEKEHLVIFGHEQPFLYYSEYEKLSVLLRLLGDKITFEL